MWRWHRPDKSTARRADLVRRVSEGAAQAGTLVSCKIVDRCLRLNLLIVATAPIGTLNARFYKFREEQTSFWAPGTLLSVGPGVADQNASIFEYQAMIDIDVPWAELVPSIYGLMLETPLGAFQIRGGDDGILHPLAGLTLHYYRDFPGSTLRFGLLRFGWIFVYVMTMVSKLLVLCDLAMGLLVDRQTPDSHPGKTVRVAVGEYTNSARDNAYALFRGYRRDKDRRLNMKYIVEPGNLDGVEPNGRDIVAWGSRRHIWFCLLAAVVAFSHHSVYVYPLLIRHLSGRRFRQTRTLFLQHGIMALKPSIAAFGARGANYDMFNVSSEFEQSIVVRHGHLPSQRVPIGGLPRHDLLREKARERLADPRQVLVFPTWRRGLERVDSASAASSIFVEQWRILLTRLRSETGLKIRLILHPAVARHAQLFADCVDRIDGAKDFQDALVESAALVTDYSSVCFDAVYLDKPVFFFTFDSDEVGFVGNTYLDVSTQLPGPQDGDADAVVAHVRTSMAAAWPPPSRDVVGRFFAHRDGLNGQRCRDLVYALGCQRRRRPATGAASLKHDLSPMQTASSAPTSGTSLTSPQPWRFRDWKEIASVRRAYLAPPLPGRFVIPQLYGRDQFPSADGRLPKLYRPGALNLRMVENTILLRHSVVLSLERPTRVLAPTFLRARHSHHGGVEALPKERDLFRLRHSLRDARALRVNEPLLFIGTDRERIYGHVLLEALPRLWALSHVPPETRVATSIPLTPDYAKLLSCLGVDLDRLVLIKGPVVSAVTYFPDQAFVRRSWVHPVAFELFDRLLDLRAGSQIALCERIYVSRRKVADRPLVNEMEIEAIFEALGFTTIHPQDHPIEDQIALFHGAKMIAGTGGSAMHNIVFASPGAKILVLASERWFTIADILISQVPGRLGYVFGAPSAPSANPGRAGVPWTIDARSVRVAARAHFSI